MDKTEIVIQNYVKDDIFNHIEACKKLLINAYETGFKRGTEKQRNVPDWIPTNKKKPPNSDPVQILVYDDSGDSPFIYVYCGRYFNDDLWITDNDEVSGYVIGWKELEKKPSLEYCKALMRGE